MTFLTLSLSLLAPDNPIIGSGPQHPGNVLAQKFYELLEASIPAVVAGLLIFTLIFGLRKIKAMANASS